MDLSTYTRKDIGRLGENVAAEYLRRHGFGIVARNWSRKTGELDLVAQKGSSLHIVEVKTLICVEFPDLSSDSHRPEDNLHPYKIRKVARTAEWYVMAKGWEGEWQIDGVLVWLRKRDALAKVHYMPQILG